MLARLWKPPLCETKGKKPAHSFEYAQQAGYIHYPDNGGISVRATYLNSVRLISRRAISLRCTCRFSPSLLSVKPRCKVLFLVNDFNIFNFIDYTIKKTAVKDKFNRLSRNFKGNTNQSGIAQPKRIYYGISQITIYLSTRNDRDEPNSITVP